LTLLGLGLRRGEALALRWSRIDLDKSTVKIAKSLRRRRTDELWSSGRRRGKLVEGDTKTDDSEATLAIPEPLVLVLHEHQRDQRKAEVWLDPDLVFTTGHGTPIEPRNVNRSWERVLAKAGIPHAHVHDLRHTMATLMVRQKVDLKIVQRALRHSRHSTTADLYAHVLDDMQRAGADELAKALRELGIGG